MDIARKAITKTFSEFLEAMNAWLISFFNLTLHVNVISKKSVFLN